MGAVHEETLSQNKGCHEFEAISLSEIHTIKSLIKYRTEFDKFYELKLYENKNPYSTNGVPVFHELIDCIYLDLERYIKNAGLTDKQKYVIAKLMKGNTEQDIADISKCDVECVSKIFNNACQKIKKQNDFDWQEFIETNGYGKIPNDVKYKQCKICGKWLRINEENFYKDSKGKDGYRVICKKCFDDKFVKKSR